MKHTKLRFLATALAAVLLLTACAGGAASTQTTAPASKTAEAPTGAASEDTQQWVPTKDITFVVPYEAGGNSDIPARIFAKYMSNYADVSVNVTNIEGAGGRTGAQQVMEMDADGSVILMQPVAYPMQYSKIGRAHV